MSNTNDYINRGKAINAVHQRIKQIGYNNDPYILSIRQAVIDVPATDVVEVVRCKDCKYYEIYELKSDGTDDRRYKPSVCVKEKYAVHRKPDWFCADGERKA